MYWLWASVGFGAFTGIYSGYIHHRNLKRNPEFHSIQILHNAHFYARDEILKSAIASVIDLGERNAAYDRENSQ